MQGSIKQASPGKLPGFFFRWSSIRPLILEKAPFFVLAAVSSIITYIAQQKGGAVEDLQYLSLPARLANAVISYCSYIGKAIWPADLAVLYPHPGMLPPWQVLGAVLLLTVITLLVIYAAKQFPYLAVGWLWYLGTLIPVIGIVQVGVQAMADRYTYVPLIGVLIMIAWGVPDLLGRWRYRMIALTVPAIVILLVFTFVTWKQVHYWQDTVTLFRRALAVTANNYVAHYNFGNSLQDQGKLEEAVSHYFEALRIHPNYADAHNNLGAVLQEQGYFQEAVNHYSEALRINPNYGNAYNNLGFALQEQGRYKEAFAHYSEALRINPHSAGAHSNMGDLLMIQGKTEEAIGHYHEAIRLRPDYMKTYINWGEKLAAQGKYNEAAELYERALRIKPDSAEIHYNMGTMLAARGDMDEAIAHLRETVRIKPDYAKAHNNLGNALLIQGKIDEAIYSFRQALHLKPDYRMAQENLRDALILQKKSR